MKIFEYSRPVIFANSSGSRNLQNKGHAKNTGFTVTKRLTIWLSSSNVPLMRQVVCFFFRDNCQVVTKTHDIIRIDAMHWTNSSISKCIKTAHGDFCILFGYSCTHG